MPDTPKNQAKYPQHKKQANGCGFPIMRVCVVLSLATAMVFDTAFAKYEGKETGELALLRNMLSAFDSGDIAVFDRYCCLVSRVNKLYIPMLFRSVYRKA